MDGDAQEEGDDRLMLAQDTEHLNRVIEAVEGGMDPWSASLQYAAELSAMWRAKKCPREVKVAFLTAMMGETGNLILELGRHDQRLQAWQETLPHMRTVYSHGERVGPGHR